MSSTAQVLANRQNSKHSTGPVTAAGKTASAANAIRHGLTSKQVVIPGEDPAEYDAQREALIRDLRPANSVEQKLVDELAANHWRLMRAHRIETAVLAKIAGDSPDPDAAIAQSFLERPKELDRLVRYMTSIERAYWRVFNKLGEVQKARRAQEKQRAMEQAWLESIQEQQIGFVSQSEFEPAPGPIPVRPPHRPVPHDAANNTSMPLAA